MKDLTPAAAALLGEPESQLAAKKSKFAGFGYARLSGDTARCFDFIDEIHGFLMQAECRGPGNWALSTISPATVAPRLRVGCNVLNPYLQFLPNARNGTR